MGFHRLTLWDKVTQPELENYFYRPIFTVFMHKLRLSTEILHTLHIFHSKSVNLHTTEISIFLKPKTSFLHYFQHSLS